jgi:hypothetical protein
MHNPCQISRSPTKSVHLSSEKAFLLYKPQAPRFYLARSLLQLPKPITDPGRLGLSGLFLYRVERSEASAAKQQGALFATQPRELFMRERQGRSCSVFTCSVIMVSLCSRCCAHSKACAPLERWRPQNPTMLVIASERFPRAWQSSSMNYILLKVEKGFCHHSCTCSVCAVSLFVFSYSWTVRIFNTYFLLSNPSRIKYWL